MMTEAEWDTCADPHSMLAFLGDRGAAGERKLRLFAVACCRRVWDLLTDPRSRDAVEAAERYADGAAGADGLATAYRAAYQAADSDPGNPPGAWDSSCRVEAAPVWAATPPPWPKEDVGPDEAVAYCAAVGRADAVGYTDGYLPERAAQAAVLRDLFGPLLFRPVVLDPSWLTSTVVALARGIYDERAFDRMDILADALMDAGCDNEEALNHCRG